MAIPAQPTVAISLGPAPTSPAPPARSISDEYGRTPPTGTIGLTQYYRGSPPGLVPTNFGPIHAPLSNFGTKNIPTSGNISFSNFNGTSKRIAVSYSITGNITGGLNLFPYATSPERPLATRYQANVPGWDFTWTISPGVTVTAPRVSTALVSGANAPGSWHPDVTITIVNQGNIVGASGGGRTGGFGFGNQPSATSSGQPGLSGGSAINAQRPITVTNNGAVRGGAGGGGGGGGVGSSPGVIPIPPKYGGPIPYTGERYGGGGGGGGRIQAPPASIAAPGGAGGGVPFPTAGSPGQAGSLPTHGLGGAGALKPAPTPVAFGLGPGSRGGAGGRGGQLSASGVAGQPGTISPGSYPGAPPLVAGTGGAGGARGNYAIGNSNITWPNFGTRSGGVSP